MSKLISIIIPVYNVESYIKDCLESVSKQTYKNIEIILVDDGATDNSGKICDEYAMTDDRVRVIHKKNGGLSDARNHGLDAAQGEYIMFIDSDDMVDSRIVEHLYGCMERGKAEIAICDPVHVFEPKDIVYELSQEERTMSKETAICEMWYQKSFLPSAWAKLFKAELFKDIRYRVGILFEDIDVMHELFWKAEKLVYSPSRLYAYQHREGSITTKKFSMRDCEILNICDRLKMFASNKDEAMIKAAKAYGVVGALRVELNAPMNDEYEEVRTRARAVLKEDGYGVLMDSRIRTKSRIGLMMYLWCRPLMRLVYGKINRWK